jgi:hypothetical protein
VFVGGDAGVREPALFSKTELRGPDIEGHGIKSARNAERPSEEEDETLQMFVMDLPDGRKTYSDGRVVVVYHRIPPFDGRRAYAGQAQAQARALTQGQGQGQARDMGDRFAPQRRVMGFVVGDNAEAKA